MTTGSLEPREQLGLADQGVQAVGVDDQRFIGFRDQEPQQLRRMSSDCPSPGPTAMTVAGSINRSSIGLSRREAGFSPWSSQGNG